MSDPMTRSDIAAIAQGLTGAQRKAMHGLSAEWQLAEDEAFSAQAAASLSRYKFRFSPLVQRQAHHLLNRAVYRLTPLGILVRDFLREVG